MLGGMRYLYLFYLTERKTGTQRFYKFTKIEGGRMSSTRKVISEGNVFSAKSMFYSQKLQIQAELQRSRQYEPCIIFKNCK